MMHKHDDFYPGTIVAETITLMRHVVGESYDPDGLLIFRLRM